jgi:hypothetical protein
LSYKGVFNSLSMYKKDVALPLAPLPFSAPPCSLALPFRWVGFLAFPAAFRVCLWRFVGWLLSFSFCGVFSWLLLLFLAVLFLLSLVSFGLGLSSCPASAGVRLLALSLSGSLALRLRCRVAWVVRLLQLCRRWLPLSALLVRLVCLFPSAFVLAGLLRGGSAPWLLLLLALFLREPFLFLPNLALPFGFVGWGLSAVLVASRFSLPRGLLGCRCWLPWASLPSTCVLERNLICKT